MCNVIVHGRCFQNGRFTHADRQFYCPNCTKSCVVKEIKYNPSLRQKTGPPAPRGLVKILAKSHTYSLNL